MSRRLRDLALVVFLVPCAGLAGWASTVHAQVPTSQLSAGLLTTGDLPSGLTAVGSGTNSFTINCSGQSFFNNAAATVEADFIANDGTAALGTGLSSYSPGGAAANLAAASALPQASGCSVAQTDGSQKAVSFAPLSFPSIADATLGLAVTFTTGDGSQLTGDFVVIQHGDILEFLTYANPMGSVDPNAAALVAGAEDAKLSQSLSQ